MAACAALPVTAMAASPRSPQVIVSGGTLQTYLNGKGESINVGSDQVDIQTWKSTISGNSALTLQISLGGVGGNEIGLYGAHSHATRFPIFPATAPAGWFAVVSLRSVAPKLIINLFDEVGQHQTRTAVTNFEIDNFGYYIKNVDNGVGHTEDGHNPNNSPSALTYAGTGDNTGCWWLCFEDRLYGDGGRDNDFDDAVLLLESVNPTPVTKTTWASVKARFR